MARDQDEIERDRRRLEAFVVRARRVAEHSLAGDWEELVWLMDPHFEARVENGQGWIRVELPSEEVVESAAARIRPILLETEECFYLKTLNALGYACRTLPRDAEWIRAARAEWKKRMGHSTAAYRVLVTNTVTGESHDLDAHGLALAWIYGDLVHHDPQRRKEGDPFGLRDRFRAAVQLVAWTMVATIELLAYTRRLWKDGVLRLRPDVFDAQVALESSVWEEPAQAFFAPAGTEPPSAAMTSPPAGWILLDLGTDLSPFQNDLGGQLLPQSSPVPVSPRRSEDLGTRIGDEDDGGSTHRLPRQSAKDWPALAIQRWKVRQPRHT
ncbi:hypothetical protein [Streptomyces sp. NPDC001828]|uniref:hypothetical protein n=1 Tax=Streptomyces sp. NPDC001828 TaxID=3364615 RepID=UPI0036B8759E